MDLFEDLVLYDISEEIMTDLEKETRYDECIFGGEKDV